MITNIAHFHSYQDTDALNIFFIVILFLVIILGVVLIGCEF